MYNNTPQATIGGAVPAQRLYGHSLIDLKKFRVFGCDAYVYIDNDKRGKIEPKFRKGIFVGISHEQNAYRILNIEDQSVTISRDVKFEENSFTCCIALGAHLNSNEIYNQPVPESERMPVRNLVQPTNSGRVTNSNLLNPETMISPSTVARSNKVEEDDTKMQPDLNIIRDSRDEKGSDNQLNNSVATEFNVDQMANNNEDIIEPDIGGNNTDDDRDVVEPDYELKEDDSNTIDLSRVTPTTRSGRMVAPPPRYGMVNYDAGGDLGIKGFIAKKQLNRLTSNSV